MKENTYEILKRLNNEYISEVRKFINALKENAPQKDLLNLREHNKELFYKFMSIPENPKKELNSTDEQPHHPD
jgi:hypothetical protein